MKYIMLGMQTTIIFFYLLVEVSAFQVTTSFLLPLASGQSKSTIRHTWTPLRVSSIAATDGNLVPSEKKIKDGSIVNEVAPILQGTSSKATRLRKAIQEIVNDTTGQAPIVVLGPKGSGKPAIVDELVRQLHGKHDSKKHPSAKPPPTLPVIHRLSMDDAVAFLDLFVGDSAADDSHKPSLLESWADQANSTVVITGFDSRTASNEEEFKKRQVVETAVTKLLTEQTVYRPTQETIPFRPRIFYSLHGSKEPEVLRGHKEIQWVKVPAFETRTKDLPLIAKAKVALFQKEYGLRSNDVQLTPPAIQRLLDHTWTEGEPELDQELKNALLRLALERKKNPFLFEGPLPFLLESKHMMVQTPNESIRTRLLYKFPVLRQIINSPWIFDHVQRYIVAPVFLAFLVVLFWGPQTRDHSAALTVFWAGWWPAVMLSFPFLGRIWCSICPFMVVGNLAQEVSSNMGIQLKKWPKWVETVGPLFAFALFFVILVWEELWDLPQNGALSAWLLLLITSGAVFNSVQFENRMWCRHLCPIGAMCRTFGTMSMVEVRSFKANCQGCTNPQCVNGDSAVPDPSDRFALQGCTMGLKNNQLQDMGHCTLCMSCVKNCDKETPEVNTRPLGLDFGLPWLLPSVFQDRKNMAVSQVETNYWMGALLTVLQGSVLLHYMPRIFFNLGFDPSIAKAGPAFDAAFYIHAAATAILLALPGLLSLGVDNIAIPLEDAWLRLRRSWGKPTMEDENDRRIVINAYEAILKEDKSLQDTLEELDPDGDGYIADWEFERALHDVNLSKAQSAKVISLIRKRWGQRQIESLPRDAFIDTFQQLYVEARGSANNLPGKVQLETTKTFVELFNELDSDGDGFIMPGDFDSLIDRDFRIKRSWEEKLELFRSVDVVGQGRLNLFEFMTLMRKITRAGIQEIGYGYLPLAWGSLTAYWVGLGLQELGLTLARAPDTFYLNGVFDWQKYSLVASDATVQLVQSALVIGALPISIGLTQKLCDDNKITGVRFGVHVAAQVIGAWTTLYLMLSSNPLNV